MGEHSHGDSVRISWSTSFLVLYYKMFYLNLRVVTKQKLIVDTERKTTTKENYQITEEDSKRREEQKNYKTIINN